MARLASDKIIVITPQQFREIHSDVGVGRSEQFEVIPLGIDLSKFRANDLERDEFRSEFRVSPATLLVGFVGRLTEIKNIPMLVEAAKQYFDAEDAPDAKFIIVGDGHMRGELQELAGPLGDRIIFAGNRDDLGRVYAGLDVVGLTSLNEGTPLSLIEAMASHRPVIATTVGGVADLLGASDTSEEGFAVHERGIGVQSKDAAGFAKGLIYLAKNEKLRFDLSNTGHQFAIDNYGKERLISDIRSLYHRLLEQ